MLVFEFEDGYAGDVRLEDYGFWADVQFTFVSGLFLTGDGFNVAAESGEVPNVDLVFLKMIECKSFCFVGGDPHYYSIL